MAARAQNRANIAKNTMAPKRAQCHMSPIYEGLCPQNLIEVATTLHVPQMAQGLNFYAQMAQGVIYGPECPRPLDPALAGMWNWEPGVYP